MTTEDINPGVHLGIADETLREGSERTKFHVPTVEKAELVTMMAAAGISDFVVGAGPESAETVAHLLSLQDAGKLPPTVEFTFICLIKLKEVTLQNFRQLPRSFIERIRWSFGMIESLEFERTLEEFRELGAAKFKASILNNFKQGVSDKDVERITSEADRAVASGIPIIRLNDSLGRNTPDETRKIAKYLVGRYTGTTFVLHAHNDNGLALANTLASVEAGFQMVEGSLAGYGNRSGITSLAQVAKLGHDLGWDFHGGPLDLGKLIAAERVAEAVFLRPPYMTRPVSGMDEGQVDGLVNIPLHLNQSIENPMNFIPEVDVNVPTLARALRNTGFDANLIADRAFMDRLTAVVMSTMKQDYPRLKGIHDALMHNVKALYATGPMTRERVHDLAQTLAKRYR